MTKLRVWALTDHIAGHTSQTEGVCAALSPSFNKIAIHYGWAAALPLWLPLAMTKRLTPTSYKRLKTLVKSPHPPQVIVATGRRLAAVALFLKDAFAQRGHTVRLVQIMDPVARRGQFDLIAVPEHDGIKNRKNSINFLLSPHKIDKKQLETAYRAWKSVFTPMKHKKIGVFVGGSHKKGKFTWKNAVLMGKIINDACKKWHLSALITTSRRTGAWPSRCLIREIEYADYVYDWHDPERADRNPYLGILAHADILAVTGESVSMISEAIATGKPVYIYVAPNLVRGKHRRFVRRLFALGLARPLTDLAYMKDYADTAGIPKKGVAPRSDRVLADAIRARFPDLS